MRRRITVLIVALLSAGVLLILTLSVAQMAEPPGPWIKYTGNPVVVTGTVGSWDANMVGDSTVISDTGLYKMWYTGGDDGGTWSIGYATSTDGIAWTKYAANPVLTGAVGSWDANVIAGADVVFDGAMYRMWYWGAESLAGTSAIGYATSSNGITWTKYAANPVLTGTVGSWDASQVYCPCIISDTGLYKMWYTGVDDGGTWSIGYATSPNGISWTKYSGNPVVTGTVGSWDESQVLGPDVILDGTTYRMWYTGQDADGIRRIGYATSPDGISWTKYAGNPVLDREGKPGNWESRVMDPSVLLEGDTYKMWYTGNYKQIGYASPGSYTTPGYLIFHEADGTIVYNWFTYIPVTIRKTEHNYILISGVHSNILTNDYNEVTQESRRMAHRTWARQHKYILLVPVIPRPTIPEYIYVPAFSWQVFLDSIDPFYQRPDLKVNLMIDKLVSDLRNDGYNVDEKVFVEGFSCGGMFAQRYALLHPERVQAIAAGSPGGAITLAESSYNGTQMDWPVGVNDFSSLVGYEFNQSAYQQVPQFIYIGDQDTDSSTVVGPPDLWRTQSQVDFLKNAFGYTDPVRIENQVSYLNSIGYNSITFKKYPGVGHQRTGEMINDTFAFFSDFKWPFWVYLPVIVRDYAPLALPSSIEGEGED